MEILIMQVPQDVQGILSRILESEDKWKALYMGVWGYSYVLAQTKGTLDWTTTFPRGLPASKIKFHPYTNEQLHKLLTNMDDYISLNHLQDMFSLLEDLVGISCQYISSTPTINPGDYGQLKSFILAENQHAQSTKGTARAPLISVTEEQNLNLAKKTRNCFIHKGGLVDDNWINAYKAAKGTQCPYPLKAKLPRKVTHVQKIEDWHELIVKIADCLEQEIQAI